MLVKSNGIPNSPFNSIIFVEPYFNICDNNDDEIYDSSFDGRFKSFGGTGGAGKSF